MSATDAPSASPAPAASDDAPAADQQDASAAWAWVQRFLATHKRACPADAASALQDGNTMLLLMSEFYCSDGLDLGTTTWTSSLAPRHVFAFPDVVVSSDDGAPAAGSAGLAPAVQAALDRHPADGLPAAAAAVALEDGTYGTARDLPARALYRDAVWEFCEQQAGDGLRSLVRECRRRREPTEEAAQQSCAALLSWLKAHLARRRADLVESRSQDAVSATVTKTMRSKRRGRATTATELEMRVALERTKAKVEVAKLQLEKARAPKADVAVAALPTGVQDFGTLLSDKKSPLKLVEMLEAQQMLESMATIGGGSDAELSQALELALKAAGDTCFNCGTPLAALRTVDLWCSVNLGVVLCPSCAGLHRSLGVDLSFVQSVGLDTWKLKHVLSMKLGGHGLAYANLGQELQPEGAQKDKLTWATERYGSPEADKHREQLLNWVTSALPAEEPPTTASSPEEAQQPEEVEPAEDALMQVKCLHAQPVTAEVGLDSSAVGSVDRNEIVSIYAKELVETKHWRVTKNAVVRESKELDSEVVEGTLFQYLEIKALESCVVDGRQRVRFDRGQGFKGWVSVVSSSGDPLLQPLRKEQRYEVKIEGARGWISRYSDDGEALTSGSLETEVDRLVKKVETKIRGWNGEGSAEARKQIRDVIDAVRDTEAAIPQLSNIYKRAYFVETGIVGDWQLRNRALGAADTTICKLNVQNLCTCALRNLKIVYTPWRVPRILDKAPDMGDEQALIFGFSMAQRSQPIAPLQSAQVQLSATTERASYWCLSFKADGKEWKVPPLRADIKDLGCGQVVSFTICPAHRGADNALLVCNQRWSTQTSRFVDAAEVPLTGRRHLFSRSQEKQPSNEEAAAQEDVTASLAWSVGEIPDAENACTVKIVCQNNLLVSEIKGLQIGWCPGNSEQQFSCIDLREPLACGATSEPAPLAQHLACKSGTFEVRFSTLSTFWLSTCKIPAMKQGEIATLLLDETLNDPQLSVVTARATTTSKFLHDKAAIRHDLRARIDMQILSINKQVERLSYDN